MPQLLKGLCDALLTYVLLALLGLICLAFSVFALLVYPLLSVPRGTAVGRYGIMAGFRLFSWALRGSGACRLDLTAIDALREGPPLILAPNHPSLIDALLILSRHPNIACVMKAQLMRNVFLGAGSRLARFIPSDQPRQMIKDAIAELRRGRSLLLFPEGTRTTRAPVNPLTGSVAVIARHAGVPVQVAIIESDSPYVRKGWSLLRPPGLPITYRIRLGRRFEPPQHTGSLMSALEREYAQQLAGAHEPGRLTETPAGAPQIDSYSR